MNEFKNGVNWYAIYAINPEKCNVKFPEGKISCGRCEQAYADSLGRPKCRLAQRLIDQPLYYPELPSFCPLEPTGEIIGNQPKED